MSEVYCVSSVVRYSHFQTFFFNFSPTFFTPTLPVELNCRRAVVFTVLFHPINVFITHGKWSSIDWPREVGRTARESAVRVMRTRPRWHVLRLRHLNKALDPGWPEWRISLPVSYQLGPAEIVLSPRGREDSNTHTHTHPFNGPFSGTTQVSRYQKGKTSLDFTEARDSEWQRHPLGHIHCESKKTRHQTLAHNFTDSVVNLQQIYV